MSSYTALAASVLAALALAGTVLGGQAPAKTRASPFFSAEAGSGFVVECRNSGRTTLDWPPPSQVRLDGVIQPSPEGFRGFSVPVPPGDEWEELVTLHGLRPKRVATLGFRSVWQLVTEVEPGRHTIAFACGRPWSDDLSFVWDWGVR